jgi:hypothetical protein
MSLAEVVVDRKKLAELLQLAVMAVTAAAVLVQFWAAQLVVVVQTQALRELQILAAAVAQIAIQHLALMVVLVL